MANHAAASTSLASLSDEKSDAVPTPLAPKKRKKKSASSSTSSVMRQRQVTIKKKKVDSSGRVVSVPSKRLRPWAVLDSSNSSTTASNTPRQVENANLNIDQPIVTDVDPQPSRIHQTQKRDALDKWSLLRPQAVDRYVANQGTDERIVCDRCHYSFNDPTFGDAKERCRCLECYQFNICKACVISLHEVMPTHNIEVWRDDVQRFKPLEYKRILRNTSRNNCIKAGSKLMQEIEIITDSGKIDTCMFEVQFCECHSVALQLTEMNIWPATPSNPNMAFTFGFMKMMNYLMLEGHMSLQAACQSFMWTNGWSPKKCMAIYKKLTNECFEEFRHFLFSIDNIVNDTSGCPACLKNGRVFYSLDGNFGLVRKKNSGSSVDHPKHGTKFFLDDSQVSEFVDGYNTNKATARIAQNECSTFQAGNNNRSKNKAKGLDQTGVFGCICRHGVPKLFLNMTYGERFGYPVYLLQELIERMPDRAKPVIIYDIACKLKTHMENSDDDEVKTILDKIDLAVPCWHAYGHGSHCQMRNSTRWKENCGLTDGEEMERLWAYLRKFSHITKEMTPSHRIDLISDGLLHYTKRKLVEIDSSLVHRAEKAKEVGKLASTQLDKLIKETNKDGFNHATIESWQADIASDNTRLHGRQKKAKLDTLDWKEDYVEKLSIHNSLRREFQYALMIHSNQLC